LHIDKALDVSDLRHAPETVDIGDEEDVLLASCEYFTVRRLKIDKKAPFTVTAKVLYPLLP
jgi:hypothetical protein